MPLSSQEARLESEERSASTTEQSSQVPCPAPPPPQSRPPPPPPPLPSPPSALEPAAAAAEAERSAKRRSRSLENLASSTAGATWSPLVNEVVLSKGDRGLGFSILDYQVSLHAYFFDVIVDVYVQLPSPYPWFLFQDPQNPSESVIVIRSVIRGGVASQSKCLVPGDRLVYVNDSRLDNASLDAAVQALKGAPYGPIRLGIAKPVVGEGEAASAGNNDAANPSNNEYEEVSPTAALKKKKRKKKLDASDATCRNSIVPFSRV